MNSCLLLTTSEAYALRVLRVHGIPDESLQEVFRATLLAKITYASSAWHGMCSAEDQAKLESLLKRCRRLGYYGRDEPTLSEVFNKADVRLFNRVIKREYYQNCYIYCQRATSSMGTVNKKQFIQPGWALSLSFCFFRLHDLSLCWCVFCFTLVS